MIKLLILIAVTKGTMVGGYGSINTSLNWVDTNKHFVFHEDCVKVAEKLNVLDYKCIE